MYKGPNNWKKIAEQADNIESSRKHVIHIQEPILKHQQRSDYISGAVY